MQQRIAHIVDDDVEILESVSFMLRAEAIETTIHECSEAFVAALPNLKPGCIILDIFMPGMDGLHLQKVLHEMGCRMPVIMVTGHGDIASAVAAMKEGALDFIQKPFAKSDLMSALDAAWAQMLQPASNPEERKLAEDKIASLTPRERQVIAGLVRGHPNKTIAFDLGISPRTVELYRANASRKLKARSLSELLQIAFHAGVDGHANVP